MEAAGRGLGAKAEGTEGVDSHIEDDAEPADAQEREEKGEGRRRAAGLILVLYFRGPVKGEKEG